uniref:Uncharacterized protein n=1 Tax=Trichogramma kaykai TaxID=54128 RepID=A0ABD2X347_9HYME
MGLDTNLSKLSTVRLLGKGKSIGQLKKAHTVQIRLTTENEMKCINVNSASLSFQGFYYEPNNILYPLTDSIYSQSVNNSRNASTGKLEIYRSSKSTGSTLGDEEVWLLVQKVEKST